MIKNLYVVSISHMIPHILNHVYKPCEKLDHFISQMAFLKGINHKYPVN
jgi:hypothetical protein